MVGLRVNSKTERKALVPWAGADLGSETRTVRVGSVKPKPSTIIATFSNRIILAINHTAPMSTASHTPPATLLAKTCGGSKSSIEQRRSTVRK